MLNVKMDHNLDQTSILVQDIGDQEDKIKGQQSVRIGFFSSARYMDGDRPYVASVALWQEFEGVRNNKPARPFMREAIKQAKKGVLKEFEKFPDRPELTLNRVGLLVQKTIQESISGKFRPWAALAESTVEQRRSGSSKPLIDTGYMRQSVSYKVDN